MGPVGPTGATGAQGAVSLGAPTVNRLHKKSVDLLTQLHNVRGGALSVTAMRHCEHILIQRTRSNFVAAHDERHLPTPGVDKGRPAGVQSQILSAASTHPQRRVIKGLPCKLKDFLMDSHHHGPVLRMDIKQDGSSC